MGLNIACITIDCADPAKLTAFWTEALDFTVVADLGEFVFLAPKDARGAAIGLQRVDEPKRDKNRVHMDLSADDRPAEVERLVGLGASVSGEFTVPGLTWTVLTDPEGNEFCVSERSEMPT
ncbi:VOC family protein [Allokutzneria sp. NRRL B-24872]|uniref:VOC family protein n=1 Tax=Allokutzneria sp. NRRL B-24872 TaxID=1137961 RepID=UPI000A37A512|nr:VOC family protein [Allokutzneria sp. NRRL B-24872]